MLMILAINLTRYGWSRRGGYLLMVEEDAWRPLLPSILNKKSQRSYWWRSVGFERHNGERRSCASRQCACWWVCEHCNPFFQVHECTLTAKLLNSRGNFPGQTLSFCPGKNCLYCCNVIRILASNFYFHLFIMLLRLLQPRPRILLSMIHSWAQEC